MLKQLELSRCHIFFPKGFLSSMARLQGLSMQNSIVDGNGLLNFTNLTNLTSLDLSDSTWHTGRVQLNVFFGWPALRTLKIHGCNLFHQSTELRVLGVNDLHTDNFKPGMI